MILGKTYITGKQTHTYTIHILLGLLLIYLYQTLLIFSHDCGICRIGKGLGIDYFHCKKCNVCMAISLKGRHKCIERNLESDCPICGEYMFTSTTTVIFMVTDIFKANLVVIFLKLFYIAMWSLHTLQMPSRIHTNFISVPNLFQITGEYD